MSRRLLVALVAIVALAGLSACGDDDGGIDEETTTTAEETTTTAEDEEEPSTGSDTGEEEEEQSSGSLPDGQSPGELGSDSDLDALAEVCFEGDMVGCDALYGLADADSDYEAYGDTCGGRQDQGTGDLCVDAFEGFPLPDGQSPGSLGDDSDFDALAEECFDGDLGACDELYEDSEGGSDYEAYGVTCGGRLPVAISEVLIDRALEDGVAGQCATDYASASS